MIIKTRDCDIGKRIDTNTKGMESQSFPQIVLEQQGYP